MADRRAVGFGLGGPAFHWADEFDCSRRLGRHSGARPLPGLFEALCVLSIFATCECQGLAQLDGEIISVGATKDRVAAGSEESVKEVTQLG